MAHLIRKTSLCFVLLFFAALCRAQNESRFQADLRREGTVLKACSQISKFADCGQTLVLGQPFHLAFGNNDVAIRDNRPAIGHIGRERAGAHRGTVWN